ncbi:hypothetical protein OE699_09460 [Sedimentimonas flavescens]|uniref:Lipopolysaccharide export system protein LptC n=1 Tax=Sedimentimonas flavescens TaxID=2851012 RepID=A0ABT2ZZJ3_9RHOB|nr:hypothetical protein [Sedimentimonas flavescens]MCV2879081.1 hypothetical protein [Sedimentimonas flavescens]WBL33063.1 hypothetical protein O5O51_15320 [Sinirhodobacter sp. HNIBRBA609]
MRYDNSHSMIVAWVKIALPLAALALLSTLFMFSDKVDPQLAQFYAKVDVAELAREQRMTSPTYAGMTEDGSALTVRASAARPDPNGGAGASAERLVAKIESRDGMVTDLTAAAGLLDPGNEGIRLSDGVTVQTSTGYRMATPVVQIATDRSRLEAPQPVMADGPFGTINADSMLMTTNAAGSQDLIFNGHVKLIYQPQE